MSEPTHDGGGERTRKRDGRDRQEGTRPAEAGRGAEPRGGQGALGAPGGPGAEEAAAVRAATGTLVYGFALSRITGAFVRLGIPDALAGSALPAGRLARATGTDEPSLCRLLRAATALGLLTVRPGGRYELTLLGGLFRDDPRLRRLAELYGEPAVWQAYGALEDAVRDGGSAFHHAHGTGLFAALETDGPLAARFTEAMGTVTAAVTEPVLAGFDFGGIRHLVDVGGGDGTLLAALLRAYPHLRGTLLERPAALTAAPAVLRTAGVADRCTLVEGDFFAAVPTGDGGPADACLLKNILHNFGDDDCVRVLRACRAALRPGGRVLVPALVLPEAAAAARTQADAEVAMALSDVEMMVLTAGRERTLAEYRGLFARAGLALPPELPPALPGLAHHHMLEGTSGTPHDTEEARDAAAVRR
ncbi:acetylserotonin O-methyltransferase [Streptomyces sp. NBC_01808]|uniref:methyltransferase n=1 Tax=Streptomyces sp. NBC_01808 TaxID=2975947 RepID=UPI002DDAB94F|nr:methyltransferase [Streptomyces sp. NBC_01808]WSA40660.1 acetylserotonin O-methyltransferase [Streptomyces sp. NBC_01808]